MKKNWQLFVSSHTLRGTYGYYDEMCPRCVELGKKGDLEQVWCRLPRIFDIGQSVDPWPVTKEH
ncbi:hypothetical protein BD310DRAFT_980900 [Dichomitus squalens]|uniref:Uncharacterized protein n=1 Tax=Dichomitus squalens TaxID=114155 RepID=A0A4Q9PFL2_9APHY|nr:hypothetical protein BD310DRAFT_980900 [Dichomitus squalens]